MEYEPRPGDEKTALVGKGLMFDAGGYHLKSMKDMEGMQYDSSYSITTSAASSLLP